MKKQIAGELMQDSHNYRKHSDKKKKLIRKSVDECGFGRSVVVDADGVLVAGNGVVSSVPKNTPIKVVETDGTELVVVKRTGLHEQDERRKKLAFADNATADNVEWDFDAMEELNEIGVDFGDWGIKMKNGKILEDEPEIEFAEVLNEANNYIILQFKNEVDWLQAETIFNVKTKCCGSTRNDGRITKTFRSYGIARVIDGAEALDRLMKL